MSTLRVDNLNARTGSTITVPTGTKLYAPGHVIQVVQASTTSVVTTTSSSLSSTGFSCSITPTTATSKILVMMNASLAVATAKGCGLAIYRGASQIYYDGTNYGAAYFNFASNWRLKVPIIYLDSPATTSVTTYTLYFN